MDSSTQLLINEIGQACREKTPESLIEKNGSLKVLFIADENTALNISTISAIDSCHSIDIITNRVDIFNSLNTLDTSKKTKINISAHYNDFDFSQVSEQFDIFAYRISKEKAVVHHIFNQILKQARDSSLIFISGKKKEGIKNHASKLKKFGGKINCLDKFGDDYLITLQPRVESHLAQERTQNNYTDDIFNSESYQQLRQSHTVHLNEQDYQVYSKPGTYGWKKIDEGSLLLSKHIVSAEKEKNHEYTRLIDLGCGFGLLSIAAFSVGIQHMIATDNNASALLSAKTTFENNDIPAEVLADDIGNNIQERFDIVVCNPPFHQGFLTDSSLTQRFVASAYRLLKPQGYAYFVVNSFVGIEKIALSYFKNVETLENTKKFKVLKFS